MAEQSPLDICSIRCCAQQQGTGRKKQKDSHTPGSCLVSPTAKRALHHIRYGITGDWGKVVMWLPPPLFVFQGALTLQQGLVILQNRCWGEHHVWGVTMSVCYMLCRRRSPYCVCGYKCRNLPSVVTMAEEIRLD